MISIARDSFASYVKTDHYLQNVIVDVPVVIAEGERARMRVDDGRPRNLDRLQLGGFGHVG
jgi:hypothetical protein